jgi:hypothetical protein
MSLTFGGIWVAVLGTVFVQVFHISDACSTELVSKIVEFAPLATGSVMTAIGRYRLGGVNIAGIRK